MSGMIGMPVAQSEPQRERAPLKLLFLGLDSLEGKIPSLAPELDGRQLAPLLIRHALQHLQLYGQAMAVPSRHIPGA